MEFKELFDQYSQPGKVVWIGIRPDRKVAMRVVLDVDAREGYGLDGDRYQKKGGTRQVTLIQKEHLSAIGSFLGNPSINPQLTRRNIVVQGINLLALKGKQFSIDDAVFEYSGDCHPCSRMEENLGPGGYNAMRGLGGITAKVLKSGKISLNDLIIVIRPA